MLTFIEPSRPNAWRKIALAFAVFSFIAFEANSQCGCTFTIPAGTGTYFFDGVAKGVAPGNVICLSAGARDGIFFVNVSGSAANYVTIKNCGGQALIGNASTNNAMYFGNCHYIHIAGTGDVGFQYGIKIPATLAGTQ